MECRQAGQIRYLTQNLASDINSNFYIFTNIKFDQYAFLTPINYYNPDDTKTLTYMNTKQGDLQTFEYLSCILQAKNAVKLVFYRLNFSFYAEVLHIWATFYAVRV